MGLLANQSISSPFHDTMEGGCVVLKTKHAAYGERDMFLFHGPFAFRGFQPDQQSNANLAKDVPGTYGISMVKMHPRNTAGYVKLRTADPRDPPEINFRLYAEARETDLGAMKDTIAWARAVHARVSAPVGPIKSTEPPCGGAGPDRII